MSEWKIETFANPAEETAIYTGEAGSYVNIGSVMGKDTAQRVVECVNALAGVEDPAAFVEAAKVLAAWAERRGTTIANGDDYGEIIDCLTHLRPGWGKERI